MSAEWEALRQGALDAVADGWRVTPVAPNSKDPAAHYHWKASATDDPNRVREIWTDVPYNVAGVTGRYLVLDVDVAGDKQGAESLERLVAEYGMPSTRVHRSPSGGTHYIFLCPEDWNLGPRAPLNKEYPNIDIRAGVSYILLPPSVTPVGRYSVEVDIAPAPAPDWIKTLWDGPIGSVGTRTEGRIRPDEIAFGHVGSRDVTLTRLAGKLRRSGHNQVGIVSRLVAAQAEWRIQLPMTQLLKIAASAERWEPDVLGGIPRSSHDLDNAGVVLTVSDNCLHWRAEDRTWTVWDGQRWGSDSHRGVHVVETVVMLEDMLDALNGADEHAAKSLLRKISKLKSAQGSTNMWSMMQILPGVTMNNADFDQDPYLLNVANGIVDLRDGTLLPHDKRLMLTRMTRCEYDPTADMGDWLEFVDWCCAGDAEQQLWLQVALGQALIGRQDEHLVVFMYGTGKNGKTVLTDAILKTLGDYGMESSAELLTAKGKDQIHTEMIASLHGKRMVVCPEPEKGSYWAASRVKALTGGDIIRARHLYGREFSFDPSHTLIVHGNYQPEIRDLSMGFRRRMLLVPFTNVVPTGGEIKNLGERLAGPAVLRWLVGGAMEYLNRNGLPASQRVRAATEEYIAEQDQMSRWFAEMCEPDPDGWESTGDLYELYRYWVGREGLRFIETKAALVNWLHGSGYHSAMRRRNGSSPIRGLKGLKILAQGPNDEIPV
ncbi:MAG TPA: phage/plasmid primase, P4 family [Propionibacteriaceae bacterium]|nr:phage/plasmid primase, P4 family [Propionibacteriaceae bacterium]